MVAKILLYLIAGFVLGFVYRTILKLVKSKKINVRAKMNIGKADRGVRLMIGIITLILGTYWNSQILLIAAGFCFFEAMFSWCGFYAILGKNTCEI